MQNDRYLEQLTRSKTRPEPLQSALEFLKLVPQLQAGSEEHTSELPVT